ncbi:MAG TPA: thioredoxin [Microthrixaceae bacterium]|nr:thioredoxin [Microthrixaceae bacterium]
MADVTDATFQTAVIDRSKVVPVVVDLWAEWCGPCKTLGPIIERVIDATNGKVELAKVDVDSNPNVAQAFKVQSIPAVFAVVDGRPVDQFIGAIPEAEIEEFVNKLLPVEQLSEVDMLIGEGSEESLRAALELESDNVAVVLALAELLASTERPEEAEGLLARIPESPEKRRVSALARTGPADATDVEVQLLGLLDAVKADEEARKRFVDLLELLPDEDPSKAQWRRKLTAQLF